MTALSIADFESVATGRRVSLFQPDYLLREPALRAELAGASVALVGAAGSIGGAVVRLLAGFGLRRLYLIDISENNLVEVVRDLRSAAAATAGLELTALPIGMGEPEFAEFLDSATIDLFLNFSAMKHVRSEKDVMCLKRMVRTNVLALDTALGKLGDRCRRAFSVSSDKAVRPANLMGASKNVMEQALLAHDARYVVSSARFANVSFSDGSLPFGFLRRIEKRQPLAAPNDVQRYFISHREAAELSVLAAVTGATHEIFFPGQGSALPARRFSAIAVDLLERLGYTPVECADDDEARGRASELIASGRWPCVFAPSDTTGEKDLEEFVGDGETAVETALPNIGVCRRDLTDAELDRYRSFVETCRRLQGERVAKARYVEAFQSVVPGLSHAERHRYLDSKM